MAIGLDLIQINDLQVTNAINIYFHWKQVDAEVRSISTRGLPFPAELSETFACYALGYMWNKGSCGDAIDVTNGNRIIEMKASSAMEDSAPSSFSPSEQFDELVFIRLNRDEDCVYIYLTGYNSEMIKDIKVNSTQTLRDQQNSTRRPRFSIMDKIIKPNNMTPNYRFCMRDKTITRLN